MKYILLFLCFLLVFLSGCIVIPFPHTAVPNSNIYENVVDEVTGIPIDNIEVSLMYSKKIIITDVSGHFQFNAEREQYYFIQFPLLPLDQGHGKDWLYFIDREIERHKRRDNYSTIVIEVNSFFYPTWPIVGTPRNDCNLDIFTNLGNVTLYKIAKDTELNEIPFMIPIQVPLNK